VLQQRLVVDLAADEAAMRVVTPELDLVEVIAIDHPKEQQNTNKQPKLHLWRAPWKLSESAMSQEDGVEKRPSEFSLLLLELVELMLLQIAILKNIASVTFSRL
jgi:hypothetical protein